MAEYIEREEAMHIAFKSPFFSDAMMEEMKAIPSADVVSLEAYKQVAWERDQAIQQLREDYGVGLGEKKADVAPVRHGEWILGHVEPGYFTPGGNRPWICSKCKQVVSWSLARPEYNYCHNCGSKMDGVDFDG